jgi:hypothetical protein
MLIASDACLSSTRRCCSEMPIDFLPRTRPYPHCRPIIEKHFTMGVASIRLHAGIVPIEIRHVQLLRAVLLEPGEFNFAVLLKKQERTDDLMVDL